MVLHDRSLYYGVDPGTISSILVTRKGSPLDRNVALPCLATLYLCSKWWGPHPCSATTDLGSTQSILVLHSRSLYYGVDSGTIESILVLHSRSWYYRVDLGTTQSIFVLRSRFRYYRVDLGTTQSILVLQSRSWYYTVDLCTTESIPVL